MEKVNKNSLFDSDERYTKRANTLSQDLYSKALDLLKEIQKEGYSVREAVGILYGAITEAECVIMLTSDSKV